MNLAEKIIPKEELKKRDIKFWQGMITESWTEIQKFIDGDIEII
jgi:hypothetical protein